MLFKKSKNAQMSAPIRIFLILIGLVIFFASYPVLSGIINAVADLQTDPTIAFLIKGVLYVVIIGLFAWILKGDV